MAGGLLCFTFLQDEDPGIRYWALEAEIRRFTEDGVVPAALLRPKTCSSRCFFYKDYVPEFGHVLKVSARPTTFGVRNMVELVVGTRCEWPPRSFHESVKVLSFCTVSIASNTARALPFVFHV